MEKKEIAIAFQQIQAAICSEIEQIDGKAKFESDLWQRSEGGGGNTRVLQNGAVLEKAGVAFSEVYGPVSEKMRTAFGFSSSEFYATGVSIVMHPGNPFAPIVHMNIRYFELPGQTWWFGGGIDLTPIYVDEKEAAFFHQALKNTCDRFDASYYTRFKAWADDYFYIPHRQETRGIGGIFFDRLSGTEEQRKGLFDFVVSVGQTFAPTYGTILKDKKNVPYEQEHKTWQAMRRSRYVEFNLVYDKGTKFGLDSDGRIESILMSMPPMAEWHYNYKPLPGSPEAMTLNMLKKERAWL